MGRRKVSAPLSEWDEGRRSASAATAVLPSPTAQAGRSPFQGQCSEALTLITHLKYKKERVTKKPKLSR